MARRTSSRTKKTTVTPVTTWDQGARVRHLLVLDANALLARLQLRGDELVSLFSRLRDRSPLLTATSTLWPSIGFDSLAALTPVQQRAASRFYEKVGELRWYLQYTEDMPLQLRATLEASVKTLTVELRALTDVLGPLHADGQPVVDAAAEKPAKR